MWLGILPDLPLFYLTCPVGPTLLGKTDVASLKYDLILLTYRVSEYDYSHEIFLKLSATLRHVHSLPVKNWMNISMVNSAFKGYINIHF